MITEDVLKHILDQSSGIEANKQVYKVKKNHRAAIYLSEKSQAFAVQAVSSITLHQDFVAIVDAQDTQWYVPYSTVHALSIREEQERRAGF